MRTRWLVCFGLVLAAGCKSGSPPSATGGSGSASALQWGPQFPGAGNSESAKGLPHASMTCFYPAGSTTQPAATLEYKLEAIPEGNTTHLRLTFSPDFVDNTYGVSALGWGSRGHVFKDLVGSDHAQLALLNPTATVLDFKADYISQDPTMPSGYRNLGALGGDGKMVLGAASAIVKTSTSLDRNLNERGLSQYTVDSPATDAQYTPNPAAPGWDYRVVYESWVNNDAFGPSGFKAAQLTFVHASPSKTGQNTVTVTPAPCPPSWQVPCDTAVSSDCTPVTDPPASFAPGGGQPSPIQ
jgi:hypothetical protein